MQFIYKFEVMTTPCELILFEEDKSKADMVAQAILQEAKRLEKKYNYFDHNSYLSLLNQREVCELDVESKHLLQRAIRYYHETNKVFDITIATIKDLYKTSQTVSELQKQKELLYPFVGCEHLKIKKNKLSFDNLHTKIDLGGFVKEYAVDQAVKILKKRKITAALVNFGGDIYALGKKPNGEKFRIGIKNPNNPDTFICFEEIENQALTTSASYERSIMIEGEVFSHIMNLTKSKESPKSVSVISNSCVESGVFSTSMMIDPTIVTGNKVIVF